MSENEMATDGLTYNYLFSYVDLSMYHLCKITSMGLPV